MIEVEKLNFAYPGKVVLEDVSFSIAKGSITALVGPNGAGKTTLLRCLVALEKPDSGLIRIAGLDVTEHPREVHRMCGYLSDFFGLYDSLTVRQCITYAAWTHRIGAADLQKRLDAVIATTALGEMADKPAGVLSRGYRQRLGIAMALVHDPALLILDEPASGMDPEARIGLSKLMLDLRRQGKTIIVSSHILNELEDYCTDMLVIRNNRIADHVRLAEHAAQHARTLKIDILNLENRHVEAIRALPHVGAVKAEVNTLFCEYTGGAEDQAGLLRALVQAGIPVLEVGAVQHTLQDAYMNVTGKAGEKR